jgi:hypothetical protein
MRIPIEQIILCSVWCARSTMTFVCGFRVVVSTDGMAILPLRVINENESPSEYSICVEMFTQDSL